LRNSHIWIVATTAAQAAADLYTMSQATTNKSVQVDWLETRYMSRAPYTPTVYAAKVPRPYRPRAL
jgi:hypothetical protein